jgi:hypothetical protein
VAGYGALNLRSAAGLNEQYLFSSDEKASRFAESLVEYQTMLRVLCDRVPDQRGSDAQGRGAALPPNVPKDRPLASIGFLSAANAVSPDHAAKVLGEFSRLLKAEVDAFSGDRTPRELENLVNELARVPDVVRSFFRRTPVAEQSAAKIVGSTRVMVCRCLGQLRTSVEQAEPKPDNVKRLLRLIYEAEDVLRR